MYRRKGNVGASLRAVEIRVRTRSSASTRDSRLSSSCRHLVSSSLLQTVSRTSLSASSHSHRTALRSAHSLPLGSPLAASVAPSLDPVKHLSIVLQLSNMGESKTKKSESSSLTVGLKRDPRRAPSDDRRVAGAEPSLATESSRSPWTKKRPTAWVKVGLTVILLGPRRSLFAESRHLPSPPSSTCKPA